MKRISFITLCLVVLALTAKAQVVPHYGESVEKETGKLRGKAWISSGGSFRQETPGADGKMSVIIYRTDSAKVYKLDMEKKTWISFSISQVVDGTLSGIRAFERESHNVKRTLINQEVVEGKTCNHYRVKTATAMKGGMTDHADWEEWIYEPQKLWIQRTDEIRPGYYLVHRNIVVGPQPEHLFEIPKDFKGMTVPLGGMLEMFTGKKEGQLRQDADLDNKVKDMQNAINRVNDPNKTDQQKIQEAAKLLEELNKKKK